MGIVAFFAVAGAGALVRSRHSRALRWARNRPWRFAVIPGAAAAIIVFVLTVLDGSGVLGGAFTALWHGALAYGADRRRRVRRPAPPLPDQLNRSSG